MVLEECPGIILFQDQMDDIKRTAINKIDWGNR